VRYYRWVERAFRPILDSPTKADMLDCVQKLLAEKVSPISVNTYLRGFKAYVFWLHAEGHLKENWKIQFLKCEQKVLATLSANHVSALLGYKPTGVNLARAHIAALVILDSGIRASELLGLTLQDVDLDAFAMKVHGKGGKQRVIPFSIELRKLLWRHLNHRGGQRQNTQLLVGTKNYTKVSVRNLERDFKILGKQLGITGVRFSPHTLRHTMAANWLRRGGDLFMLSRVLGHSSISTTAKYLRSIGVADIQPTAQRVSLLSARGR
jgi:integrase/recombinase XerD